MHTLTYASLADNVKAYIILRDNEWKQVDKCEILQL